MGQHFPDKTQKITVSQVREIVEAARVENHEINFLELAEDLTQASLEYQAHKWVRDNPTQKQVLMKLVKISQKARSLLNELNYDPNAGAQDLAKDLAHIYDMFHARAYLQKQKDFDAVEQDIEGIVNIYNFAEAEIKLLNEGDFEDKKQFTAKQLLTGKVLPAIYTKHFKKPWPNSKSANGPANRFGEACLKALNIKADVRSARSNYLKKNK